jgi:hypothetical protein
MHGVKPLARDDLGFELCFAGQLVGEIPRLGPVPEAGNRYATVIFIG